MTERHPPEDDRERLVRAHQTRNYGRPAGRAALRVVGDLDQARRHTDTSAAVLPDLSVDEVTAERLEHADLFAQVIIELDKADGLVLHKGLDLFIYEFLRGRDPLAPVEDTRLRVTFALTDTSADELHRVSEFARALAELVAPGGHREPRVETFSIGTRRVDY